MNATMKPTPAAAEMRKASATPRSARFSALVPRTGKRSRRWTMWMPSVSAPATITSSGDICRSSSADRSGLLSLTGLRSDPQDHDHDQADTADPDHDGLGHRADPADPAAARVGRGLHVLDVGDDRLLLGRRDL